jgi:hypothetical protein
MDEAWLGRFTDEDLLNVPGPLGVLKSCPHRGVVLICSLHLIIWKKNT